jgi:putative transcriptional regulator
MTTESLRGQLLIASPALIDPNFRRTVVLVVAHDEDGAVGVVLNRTTETEVGDAVPELAEARAETTARSAPGSSSRRPPATEP